MAAHTFRWVAQPAFDEPTSTPTHTPLPHYTPHWLTVHVEGLSAAEVEQFYGPRCEVYEPHCCVCSSYAELDAGLPVSLTVERSEFIAFATRF